MYVYVCIYIMYHLWLVEPDATECLGLACTKESRDSRLFM